MDKHSASPHTVGRRGRWKVVLIISPLALLFGVVLLLTGIVLREGEHARQAMLNQNDGTAVAAERLLAMGRNPPDGAPTSATLARHPSVAIHQMTSSTAAFVLPSRPLIGNEAGLPPELLRQRDEINARFASFLRDVAAFEREKNEMAPQAAEKKLYEISRFFGKQILDEIARAATAHWPKEDGNEFLAQQIGLEPYHDLLAAYGNWFDQSRIALRERMDDYRQAAALSEWRLGQNYVAWVRSQAHPDSPAILSWSEYFHTQGDAEYHRAIYDYWRSGGTGYLKILDVALPRMYEDFTDRIRRAREP